jgi:hypothetical protein
MVLADTRSSVAASLTVISGAGVVNDPSGDETAAAGVWRRRLNLSEPAFWLVGSAQVGRLPAWSSIADAASKALFRAALRGRPDGHDFELMRHSWYAGAAAEIPKPTRLETRFWGQNTRIVADVYAIRSQRQLRSVGQSRQPQVS